MNSFQSPDCLVELHTLSSEQNNSLWQTLGTEIMPAAVYKVRMLTIGSEILEESSSVVRADEDGKPVQFSDNSGVRSEEEISNQSK